MLFSILEPRLERLLTEARLEAVQVLALWAIEDDCGKLREAARRLEDAIDRLRDAAPSSAMGNTNLGRHVRFLGYYLDRNEKNKCSSDIYEIVVVDLPAVELAIRAGRTERWPADLELRKKTAELLEGGHPVDAVRNAFVLLTERLRTVKRGVRERDGHKLVNELFDDEGGRLVPYMTDGPRRGLQNLLLGLYTHFRNRYAHERVTRPAAEATALVLLIDGLLGDLAKIKRMRRRGPARASQAPRR